MERIASWRGKPNTAGTPTQNVFIGAESENEAAVIADEIRKGYKEFLRNCHDRDEQVPVSIRQATNIHIAKVYPWLVVFNFVATKPEIEAVKPYLPAAVADGLYDFV